MKDRLRLVAFSVLAIGLIPAASSYGGVDLGFKIGGATPVAITVTPGSYFLISVVVHSSTATAPDQITAIDYRFTSSASLGLYPFSIGSRNSSSVNSAFALTYKTPDSTVAGIAVSPNVTNYDLGGNTTNFPASVSNNTFEAADYLIKTSQNALPATNFSFTFSSDSIYSGPTVSDGNFTSLGSINVLVVAPEPGSLALVSLGVLALRRRRRAA